MAGLRILVATNNAAKRAELADLLADDRFELVSPLGLGLTLDPEETGTSFIENAIIKAEAFRDAGGCIALADDSGLEVEALGGAPGIYSARYGGPGKTDRDRNDLLLEQLQQVPRGARAARFVASIAVAVPGRPTCTFQGQVDGAIALEPVGRHGFGYDPIFQYGPSGRTFGQLTSSQKSRISHRARALVGAVAYLRAIENGSILEPEHPGG